MSFHHHVGRDQIDVRGISVMAEKCNPFDETIEIPMPPNVPMPRKRSNPAHHAQTSGRDQDKRCHFYKKDWVSVTSK